MESELQISDEIVPRVVFKIVEVINVVDDNFVVLSPLKVILNFETLNPLRGKGVHDDLCVTNFSPHSPTNRLF
jgi:hypothetical protein